MLHGRAAEPVTNPLEKRIALAAHLAQYANFDQLVRFQRDVDFVQDAVGEAVRADRHDRTKMMRLGAKNAAFAGSRTRHSMECNLTQ